MLALFTLLALGQPAAPTTDPPPPIAEQRPPRRFKLQADLSGRLNPRGAKLRVTGSYRHDLGEPSRAGWSRPYLQGGLSLALSPASGTASVYAEWMQAAFFVLRLQGDLYRYFGAFSSLVEFPSKDAPFGDAEIDAASGRALKRFGGRVLIQPTLRAKLGWVLAQSQLDLAWFRFGGGGPYFLQREYDTLLKDGDGLVASRTAVLAELWSHGAEAKLLAGPFYELQRTFAAGLQRQRAGVAIQLCPVDFLGPVTRPRVAVQIGVNLQDRNRENQLFIAGALNAEFDL